jgi:hypothetical protein
LFYNKRTTAAALSLFQFADRSVFNQALQDTNFFTIYPQASEITIFIAFIECVSCNASLSPLYFGHLPFFQGIFTHYLINEEAILVHR